MGSERIGEHFRDRLTVLSKLGTSMNASITISNMQTKDSGTYTCEVLNPPDIDGTTQSNIRVHVFGTKTSCGL